MKKRKCICCDNVERATHFCETCYQLYRYYRKKYKTTTLGSFIDWRIKFLSNKKG